MEWNKPPQTPPKEGLKASAKDFEVLAEKQSGGILDE
jgi:hypothetical protein